MAPPIVKPGAMGFHTLSATSRPKYRMIMSIEGETKQGKNHFSFTAPGRIGFHSFDHGDEGMIEKFLKGQRGLRRVDIDKAEYRVNVPPDADVQTTSKACDPIWQAFRTNYQIGLGKYRTTVVDTGTDVYELVRMAYFGKLQQVMPHHYAPVNTEMKELFRSAYSSDSNVIFIHRVKDEYENKKGKDGKETSFKTGRRIMAGYRETPYETQVHLRCFRDAEGFKAEIITCRQNPDIEGMELTGDMCSFPALGQLVYPDSTEKDWQ